MAAGADAAAGAAAAAPARPELPRARPSGGAVQVLIDADNVSPARLRLLLAAVLDLAPEATITAAGRSTALDRTDWPPQAEQIVAAGWQRADLALAEIYQRDTAPLVLASGDGDFGLLARGHPGPVLIVSGAPSHHLLGGTTVVDPALEGPQRLRDWLRTVTDA